MRGFLRFFILFSFSLSFQLAFSQLPPNQPEQDCFNAIPICSNVYAQPNSYTGQGRVLDEIPLSSTCLVTGEVNNVWYILTVKQAGDLCFTLNPNNPADDYDWAVFNLSNSNCSDIASDLSLAVSCNDRKPIGGNGTTGPNGNVGGGGGQFEECIPVLEGETYVININSFAPNNGGYILDLTSSTAVIFDDIPPEVDSVSHDCGEITVTFTENVRCNTVSPRDFSITGPGNTYSVVNVNSPNCSAIGNTDSTLAREFVLEVFPPISTTGTYTISLVDEVLDACSNLALAGSRTVAVNLTPATTGAFPGTICQGDSSSLRVDIANAANFNISWSPGNLTGSQIRVFPDTTTSYTVTVTDNTGCNIYSESVEVQVIPRPTATFDLPAESCSGDQVQVNFTGDAPANAQFLWDFEGGTIASGSGAGPYEVVWNVAGIRTISLIAEVDGCRSSLETNQIEVFQTPEMSLDVPISTCANTPSILSYTGNANPAANYSWDFGGGIVTSNNGQANGPGPHTLEFPNQGQITVALTVEENGCSNSISDAVSVFPVPIAEIAPVDTQCFNVNVFQFEYGGPNTNIEAYVWDFGDGNGSTLANPNYTYTTPGVKTVELGVLDNNGCIDIEQLTFEIFEAPEAIFLVDPACEGDKVSFENLSVIPASTTLSRYEWDYGDQTGSSQINPTHRYAQPGFYTVSLAAVTEAGCSDTALFRLGINPKPTADFILRNECLGDPTLFLNISEVPVLTDDVLTRFSWDLGDGTSSRTRSPGHTYGDIGNYEINLLIETNKGCLDSLSRTITIYPSDQPLTPVNDTVCFGKSALLSVEDFPQGSNISWYADPASTLPFFRGISYFTPPLIEQQTVFAQAISPQGCRSQFTEVSAFPIEQGFGQIFSSDTLVEIPNAIINFSVEGTIQAQDYFWNFGDGESSTSDAPAHEYQFAGIYNVEVGIVDIYGCEYRFNTVVEVKKTSGFTVPSAFTPNGDGINDEFYLVPKLVRAFRIKIFDRWGKLVFESSDPDFRWRGATPDGKSVPEGVYMFRAQAQDEDGDVFEELGTVTIIR